MTVRSLFRSGRPRARTVVRPAAGLLAFTATELAAPTMADAWLLVYALAGGQICAKIALARRFPAALAG